MLRKVIITLIVVLIIAWGLAYWYIGADAKFLWGLIKSGFRRSETAQVVQSPINANVATNATTATPTPTKKFLGFEQTVIASGFTKPTRMAFEPGTDDLFVSELRGKIWRVKDDGTKQEVASGFNQLLGISFDTQPVPRAGEQYTSPPISLLASSRGTISRLWNQPDDTYGQRQDIVTGLPAGRHQTDLALIGPDGKLYIATGSRSDRGETAVDEKEAAVLVADADGSNPRVFAKGLRNPYGMTFYNGKLYVSDNGQDVPASGVPDELNMVEEGRDHGWVGCWGVGQGPDCVGTEPPVALLQEHSSANGFAFYDAEQFPAEYRGNVFIALWGANSRDPDIGKKVVRLIPQPSGLWGTEDFITGLGNPIDIKVDPGDGSLLILDYGRGEVTRVSAKYE